MSQLVSPKSWLVPKDITSIQDRVSLSYGELVLHHLPGCDLHRWMDFIRLAAGVQPKCGISMPNFSDRIWGKLWIPVRYLWDNQITIFKSLTRDSPDRLNVDAACSVNRIICFYFHYSLWSSGRSAISLVQQLWSSPHVYTREYVDSCNVWNLDAFDGSTNQRFDPFWIAFVSQITTLPCNEFIHIFDTL